MRWIEENLCYENIFIGVLDFDGIIAEDVVLFDVASAASIRHPIESYLASEMTSFDWRNVELETATIEIDRDSFGQLMANSDYRRFGITRWKLIRIGFDEETNATISQAGERRRVRVDLISSIPRNVNSILRQFSLALDVRDATEDEIRAVLPRIPPIFVVAYDVGQASCSTACDNNGMPILYFDFGWPTPANRRGAPFPHPTFCLQNNPPIVLSHWHEDHYGGMFLNIAALNSIWLAPRQALKPTAIQHRALLITRGHLRFVAASVSAFAIWEIIKGTGKAFNDAGLALVVNSSVLLPGDAKYSRIPLPVGARLTGLVATHHGGQAKNIPPAYGGRKLVVSSGIGNTYGHPVGGPLAPYAMNGWHMQVFLANRVGGNGNAFVSPSAGIPLPFTPSCNASCGVPLCHLVINQ